MSQYKVLLILFSFHYLKIFNGISGIQKQINI